MRRGQHPPWYVSDDNDGNDDGGDHEDDGDHDDDGDDDEQRHLLPTSDPPHLYNSFVLDPCW